MEDLRKDYRIQNRITKEVNEVTAESAQEACDLLGWRIGDCYVTERPPRGQGQKKEIPPKFGLVTKDLGTDQQLAPTAVNALVLYSQRYHLDAYRGHVVYMYGKPYITIDGYLFHANRSGVPYTLSSRPFYAGERTEYMIPEGAHAWLARVAVGEGKGEFTGIGIVTKEEIEERSKKTPQELRSPVVAKHPWQLAQKRAEWQALRRGFPIGEEEEAT